MEFIENTFTGEIKIFADSESSQEFISENSSWLPKDLSITLID